jgi:hypothetical protein
VTLFGPGTTRPRSNSRGSLQPRAAFAASFSSICQRFCPKRARRDTGNGHLRTLGGTSIRSSSTSPALEKPPLLDQISVPNPALTASATSSGRIGLLSVIAVPAHFTVRARHGLYAISLCWARNLAKHGHLRTSADIWPAGATPSMETKDG